MHPSHSIVHAAMLRHEELITQAARERFLDHVESTRSASRSTPSQRLDLSRMLKTLRLAHLLRLSSHSVATTIESARSRLAWQATRV